MNIEDEIQRIRLEFNTARGELLRDVELRIKEMEQRFNEQCYSLRNGGHVLNDVDPIRELIRREINEPSHPYTSKDLIKSDTLLSVLQHNWPNVPGVAQLTARALAHKLSRVQDVLKLHAHYYVPATEHTPRRTQTYNVYALRNHEWYSKLNTSEVHIRHAAQMQLAHAEMIAASRALPEAPTWD